MSLVDLIGIKTIVMFAVIAPFIFLMYFALQIEDKKDKAIWFVSILYAEIFMLFLLLLLG